LPHQHRILSTNLLLAIGLSLILSTPSAHAAPADIAQGYRDMYNRDFRAAHVVFAAWIAAHPEDPFGPASDAAAYLFGEFDSLNVIDVQLFNDTSQTSDKKQLPIDPNLRADFNNRTDQAEKLADIMIAKNANDAQALFVKMFIYGLRADYAEMLDKSDFKALKYSKIGAQYSDRALAADPQLYDAHIATGFENYMLSLKPAPVRFIARLLGGQTDKAKGISELKLTAQNGKYLAPFAKILLSVAELREGNNAEAKAILQSLAHDFPENPMYPHQVDRIH
jgi:hypothetical protein